MNNERINLCGVFESENEVFNAIKQAEEDCVCIKDKDDNVLTKISAYDAKVYEKISGKSAAKGVEDIVLSYSKTGDFEDGICRICEETGEDLSDALEYLFSQKLYEMESEDMGR